MIFTASMWTAWPPDLGSENWMGPLATSRGFPWILSWPVSEAWGWGGMVGGWGGLGDAAVPLTAVWHLGTWGQSGSG